MAKYHPKASESLTTAFPPCFHCVHLKQIGTQFNPHDIPGSLQGWTCRAFPQGIPYTILRRYTDHLHPAAGQVRDYVFTSERIETGQGQTGWQYIMWNGRYVDAPNLKGKHNG